MRDRLLIFAWHSVTGSWTHPSSALSGVLGFEQQLIWLTRMATVVPLAPALRRLATGRPLPPRAVALTFDGGYRDSLHTGVPVLERLGHPATFFLVPGILSGNLHPWREVIAWAFARTERTTVTWNGRALPIVGRSRRTALKWVIDDLHDQDRSVRRRSVAELLELLEPKGEFDPRAFFLDWDGARELVRRGFSVGAQSTDEAVLSRASTEVQLRELAESRKCLEGELGVRVDLLAYSNSQPAHEHLPSAATRRAGYTHALTGRAGWNTRTTSLFEIRRVVLDPSKGVAGLPGRWVADALKPRRSRLRTAATHKSDRPSTSPQPGHLADELRIERAGLDDLRGEWMRLAVPAGNLFGTWEWASCWWRHFGKGREPLVTVFRAADGELVGILPLYRWASRPLDVLRFIGHGVGDQLGPIYVPGQQEAVARAARRALERIRFSVFVGEHLLANELWSDALDARVISREGSPVLRAPDRGWAGYLAGRSSNFRQQLGRRERNLARSYRLVFRLVEDPDELPDALEVLFQLHGLRWRKGGSAFEPRAAFHKEFAAIALDRGWLRLWLMELDGRPAAAWYGFRYGDVEWYYQSGRDPGFDHMSAGSVLLAHSIRQAFEDGVAEYRFGRGHDPYKYRFTEEDPGLETISLTRGFTARTTLASAQRAYPLVKRWMGRLRWEVT